jgi:uncharacterized repeat protein (TIGR01451 family)
MNTTPQENQSPSKLTTGECSSNFGKFAATDSIMKISLIRSILVYLLLSCLTITAQNRHQQSPDGPISVKLGDIYKKGGIKIEDVDLTQDGPTSVTYGNTYKKGEFKIEPYDLATMPSLPAGYEALNNKAYLITTAAIVSGPHIISFSAASVSDEEIFRKLRIFHAEPDTFDPESPVWKDRTLLNPTDGTPNFATKTLLASSEELGVFVIGKLVREIPPSTAAADLSVTCEAASDRVTAPSPLSYTVKVTNKGPDTASDIGLIDSLAGSVTFLSFEPSQGKCKKGAGHFYCKLGSLKAGETATIIVKLKPDEGKASFPAEGSTALNSAFAKAQEKDPYTENNRSADSIIILPDPNLPPAITLVSPKEGELYVGPTDITLEAVATDDRGIQDVQFYDNGIPIGAGTSSDGKKFVFLIRDVSFGRHRLWAIVTDTGGRKNDSGGVVFVTVNGSAKIEIDSPRSGSLFMPNSDLILDARVTHPSGLVTKVEVFANEERLGEANAVGGDNYRYTWRSVSRSVYSLVFVATDGSGVTTSSSPVRIIVSRPPTVKLIKPSPSSSLDAPTNLTLSVTASQPQGRITRIDFYANDQLLGSASDVGTDQFSFTWRDVQPGEYALKAIAVDDLGATGTSEIVPIKAKRRNKGQ